MAEKPKEILRCNEAGYMEAFDENGNLLWSEAKKPTKGNPKKVGGRGRGAPRKDGQDTHHYIIDANGKKLWVPKGTNPDVIPRLVWPYSEVTAAHVCQLVTEGNTIADIGLMEGLPPSNVIWAWRRKYKQFDEEMKLARQARAEHYHDKVFEIVKDLNEGNHKSARVKIDAYKWGAQVGDPQTFGQKTVHEGNPDNPIAIMVDTGIRRELPSDALPAQPTTTPTQMEDAEIIPPASSASSDLPSTTDESDLL